MVALISFLIFCQALGASIGTFTAVWSELTYARAMRDGRPDTAERDYLRLIGKGLRFGMLLLLLSSLGLVVIAYMLHAIPPPALTASYWMLIALACLIIGVSWALSRRHLSFAVGSVIAFTAWWFLVYLTFGQLPTTSFGATVASFIVVTAIFSTVLQGSRLLVSSIPHEDFILPID